MRDSQLPDPASPVHRYFAGLAENTFQSHLGVVDPPLIDYLTELLIRSIRADRERIRGVTGRPLMSIQEMVAEASARLGDARRELHRYIGDFTLFWAGVYPEALRSRETAASDQFETYCSFGKRSYLIASSIEAADEKAPPAHVLERLSERYDLCCYGLREVRRQWESRDDELGPGSILLN
jgi:hypothetical protein